MKWTESEVVAPKLQLAGFQRLTLRNLEARQVNFTIKSEQMALWMADDSGFKVFDGKQRH